MGYLYVLDGSDGSGKRTQAELLTKYLESIGRNILFVSFPRYTETFFGKFLRECLDGKHGDFIGIDPYLASLPYAMDRMQSVGYMRKFLSDGGDVVCDRYISANQIHQGGKIPDKENRIKFLEWLHQLEYGECLNIRPDVSIYLDVPVEVSLSLMSGKQKDLAELDVEYLQNSVESARWLIEREENRWVHIHCAPNGTMRSREDIHREITERLRGRGNF